MSYHPARLAQLAQESEWSFVWGDAEWQHYHDDAPREGESVSLTLRVADDSGNLRVVSEAKRLGEEKAEVEAEALVEE